MAKHNEIKEIKEIKELNKIIEEFCLNYQNQIELIKKKYNSIIIKEKTELLQSICADEKLDFTEMKKKYIKSKKNVDIMNQKMCDIKEASNIENVNLLTGIIIDGLQYYYENKDNGIVYDINTNIVGFYKNGNVNLS
jgi:hypothetical protein